MKIKRNPIQTEYSVIIFIFIFFICSSILFLCTDGGLSFAQKDDEDGEEDEEDKLVVQARINLENIGIENTKFLRVIGFINGEETKQDIPISSIDKSKNNLNVELKVDKENDIVEASTPDEFFDCAYQVKHDNDIVVEKNNLLPKFDCNEGDLLHIDSPTQISLFSFGSQVYSKSQTFYEATRYITNINNYENSDTVKIKILVPLADKRDTEKLKIAAMVKGQIQSEVIEDVQAELAKTKDSTIKRTFTFDRNTEIGQIQMGDRYHACVSSDDLRPPEGTECEKRLIKHFGISNTLPAR
ncbi:MAG: hypothetical protein K0S93_2116 [Nitrososphaeraceae archaeon]|nr:hypothetical protein [Nitrososphaeraceae archaeon]